MISLILPYWKRQAAADKALHLLWKQYASLIKAGTLEVVVVDDGSSPAFVWSTAAGFLNLKIVRLPEKSGPKSCITAWNEGVKHASGDTIVLSCIEVLHNQPVLEQMQAELAALGPNGYVLAAAWCQDMGEWHCHSEKGSAGAYPLPKGTGRSFCAMLSRELFNRAGGFDEDYRDGAGYEDVDFVYRLIKVGAQFKIRDDLVVQHPKSGAAIAWPAGAFERNAALLKKKWPLGAPRRVTVACVQAGNYCERGAQYVNTLYDMVKRNMPPGVIWRFVCLTDNTAGLHPEIETIGLPADLEGWYGKLYLFKRGLFQEGERIVFLDLDTLVIGRLDDVVGYSGQFATLSDFYHPERLGPAAILWEAGDYAASIWEEWVAEGKPRNPMGDLWWLNRLDQGRFAKNVDRLQTLFPGAFVSYKAHCQHIPPRGARVVCFHGRPRPHEVSAEWVKEAWRIDGMQPADLEFFVNTKREKVASNVRAASALDCPWLTMEKPRPGSAAIVGGGPSLTMMLPELRAKSDAGTKVFAVNGAHAFLVKNGINPDYHVIIDARPENADFIVYPARAYILASQAAPETYAKALAAAPLTVMHMNTEGILDSIQPSLKQLTLISSGITVGMAALAASYCMGFREQYLYGMDASYEADHHAYPQALNDADPAVEAVVGGRKFKCAPWMVQMVQDFQKLSVQLADDGCEIHVRSFGMLGHVAWLMTQPQEQAA